MCGNNAELNFKTKEELHFPEYIGLQDFHVCSVENNVYLIRFKFSSENNFNNFLTKWIETSHITWRVLRTNPSGMSAGVRNLYWKSFRCQNSDIRIITGTKAHKKHTGCLAKMTVTIKRVPHRCQSKDKHIPEYPTIVKVWNQHNHELISADNVKFKDVSSAVKVKFESLFESGYSPSSALDLHKMDLLEQFREDYYLEVADRAVCPDLQWCYRLYYKIRNEDYGNRKDEDKEIIQKISENEKTHQKQNKVVEHCHDDSKSSTMQNIATDADRKNDLRRQCKDFIQLMENKIQSESGMYAFESFFKKLNNLRTDATLENALCNFGTQAK